MAAAVAGSDIDSFIREQKAKLASERNALNEGEAQQSTETVSRKQWDRQAGRQAPLAVEPSRPRTQESGLPLSNTRSAEKQRKLAAERKREYNQLLRKDKGGRGGHPEDDDEIANPSIIPFNRVDEDRERRRRMEEERHREYQRLTAKDKGGRGGHPEDDDEISNPSIIPFNRVDEDRERRRRLEEERHREYQQMKAKLEENNRRGRREASERSRQGVTAAQPERRVADRGSLLEQTDEYKANLPGKNDSDLAKIEKERQRNEEYKQYLRENNVGRRTRTSDREEDTECYATLPGLRDSHSAKVRKEQQRNREYNEYLASRGSQRSDGKPPPAPRKGWATPTYEDILEKKREQEALYRRAHDPGYGQPSEYPQTRSPVEPPPPPRNISPPQMRQAPRTREASRESSSSDCYATLPIGPYATEDAKRRQKEQYREDLQRQMREAAEGRKRQRQAEMNTNYPGWQSSPAITFSRNQ